MMRKLVTSLLLWGAVTGQAIVALADEQEALQIAFRAEPPAFILTGATFDSPAAAGTAFYITVAGSELETPPPLLGQYALEQNRTVFTPRFPLSDRVRYQVHLDDQLKQRVSAETSLIFRLERPEKPTAKVSHIYPTADALPENLLKFYIHFSEPMERGRAYENLELLRGETPVPEPFLELGEELWDGDQQRFTLFMHPGRIKRGLRLREDTGPAIEAGSEYTLRIHAGWTSAQGTPLVESYEKTFSIRPADHVQPSPERWQIETPRSNTLQPVVLKFDEPLDHAMLQRVLTVQTVAGEPVSGNIAISEQETRWEFTPAAKWSIGRYNIIVAANLEDTSGNSLARPFEVKMQENVAAPLGTQIGIEFIVK